MKELVDHMKDYAQSALVPSNRKMFMYSAHDITLATALSALDVFNNIQPPIAAMVLIELHELSPRQFFVKVNKICITNRDKSILYFNLITRAGPLQKCVRHFSGTVHPDGTWL